MVLTSTEDQILRRSDEGGGDVGGGDANVFSSTMATDGETRYMCAYKQDLI
jgi:hypothetical protein